MPSEYCLVCFAEIPPGSRLCPACGRNIDAWARETPYTQRLIHALGHPHPQVRMAAIISLQHRADPAAADPLAECALAHPIDVVQGLAVVDALSHLPASPQVRDALRRLAGHPARAVREAAGSPHV